MNTQTVLKVTNNRMFFFSSLSPNAPKITCVVVVTFYILKTFERKHFHMQHFHPFNCRPFDTPSIGVRWNLHKLNSTLRPPVNISKDVRFFIFFYFSFGFSIITGTWARPNPAANWQQSTTFDGIKLLNSHQQSPWAPRLNIAFQLKRLGRTVLLEEEK